MIRNGYPLRKQVGGQPILFHMVLASDHLTPALTLTLTCQYSLNFAAFTNCSGAVTEIGLGWYGLAGGAGEVANYGAVIYRATAAAADDDYVVHQCGVYDYQSQYNGGFSALPQGAAAGASFGLPVNGTGDNAIKLTGGGVRLDSTTFATVAAQALTEAYPADGASGSLASLLYLILANVSQYDVVGGALVARKLDGTTAAAGYLLNDPVNPTSRIRIS